MAFLVLVVDTSDSIANLNSKVQRHGKPHAALVEMRNYIEAIMGGHVDASVQATVRDSDPSVSTSGSGSTQESYNLK